MAVMSLPFAVWRSPRQPPIKQYPRWPRKWCQLAAAIQDAYMEQPFGAESKKLTDSIYLALADRVWPG